MMALTLQTGAAPVESEGQGGSSRLCALIGAGCRGGVSSGRSPAGHVHALNAAGAFQGRRDQRGAELRRKAQGQHRVARRHGDGPGDRGRRDHVHGRSLTGARRRDQDDRGPGDPRVDQRDRGVAGAVAMRRRVAWMLPAVTTGALAGGLVLAPAASAARRRVGRAARVPRDRTAVAAQHHRSDRQGVLRGARGRAGPGLAQARDGRDDSASRRAAGPGEVDARQRAAGRHDLSRACR